jgi:hypothetical protein
MNLAVQHFMQLDPRPRDTAFHGSQGASGNFGGFLVGKPARSDEHEGLALSWS